MVVNEPWQPPFEKGDQRRQSRPDQAGATNGRGNFGVVCLLAMHTKAGLAPMFADTSRRSDDFHLLYDARRETERRGWTATVRAHAPRVINPLVDLFGCKRRPLVPRLPAPFAPAGRAGTGPWRLDDVARRRLGGGLEELAEFF